MQGWDYYAPVFPQERLYLPLRRGNSTSQRLRQDTLGGAISSPLDRPKDGCTVSSLLCSQFCSHAAVDVQNSFWLMCAVRHKCIMKVLLFSNPCIDQVPTTTEYPRFLPKYRSVQATSEHPRLHLVSTRRSVG